MCLTCTNLWTLIWTCWPSVLSSCPWRWSLHRSISPLYTIHHCCRNIEEHRPLIGTWWDPLSDDNLCEGHSSTETWRQDWRYSGPMTVSILGQYSSRGNVLSTWMTRSILSMRDSWCRRASRLWYGGHWEFYLSFGRSGGRLYNLMGHWIITDYNRDWRVPIGPC